jgi:hypothetical protein
MTAEFVTKLDARFKEDGVWVLNDVLAYHSDVIDQTITVPKGFETDFASVPRLPFAYALFGGVAQEEAVIHDYLYRNRPDIPRAKADAVFFEAMCVRGKKPWVRYPMWWGVRIFGGQFYDPSESKGATR